MQQIKQSLFILFAVFIALPSWNANAASQAVEVYWEDLVPEGFNELAPPAVQHNGEMSQLQPDAPVVDTYDGKRVKFLGLLYRLKEPGSSLPSSYWCRTLVRVSMCRLRLLIKLCT